MNKQRGFTLVETILALLISAILAGIVIEIIAGPIKSYFWVTQRALYVQEAELALDMLQREVLHALAPTISTTNHKDKQTLSFHKILGSAFAQADNAQPHTLVVLSQLDNHIEMAKPYFVHLVDDENQNKLYRAKLAVEQGKTYVTFDEKVLLKNQSEPVQFNIVSELITYQCDSTTHLLARVENKDLSLVNNQIKGCQFSTMDAGKAIMVFLNLELKSLSKEPIAMTCPVLVERAI